MRTLHHVPSSSKVLGGFPGQVIDLTADEGTVRVRALLALRQHELYSASASHGTSMKRMKVMCFNLPVHHVHPAFDISFVRSFFLYVFLRFDCSFSLARSLALSFSTKAALASSVPAKLFAG